MQSAAEFKTPLRYPGGKQWAIGILAEYLPTGETVFCSPFLGGGGFELYCAARPGAQVFAYDNFAPLVEFWQTLLSRRAALADSVAEFLPPYQRRGFMKCKRSSGSCGRNWSASRRFMLSIGRHFPAAP